MTLKQYLDKLDKAQRQLIQNMLNDTAGIGDTVNEFVLSWLYENINIKDGNLVMDKTTIRKLNSFINDFIAGIGDAKIYSGAVGNLLKDLDVIRAGIVRVQSKAGLNVTDAEIKKLHTPVIDEIINQFSEIGLNNKLAQPLRDMLYRNIAAGTSFKEIKIELENYIKGAGENSGLVESYLHNTAMQAADSYTAFINKKLADTFDINYYIVSGSLIATSQPQCRYVINELNGLLPYSGDQMDEALTIADAHGLIPGTDADNIAFNKLHWGCRHTFTPAILDAEDVKLIKNNN